MHSMYPIAWSVTTSRASQPAVSILLQLYNKCLESTNVVAVSARRSRPAAVVGLPLRARQAWSMRGLWNIHGTMGYATSRLSSYTSSYSYPVPFTLSRWRCSCIPKSAKKAVGCWKAIVFMYHTYGSYGSIGRSGSSVICQARATDTRC